MASPKTILDLPADLLAATLACLGKQPASDTPRPEELVVDDFASLRLSCKTLRDVVSVNMHSLAVPAAKLPTRAVWQAAYFHAFPAVRELAIDAVGRHHVHLEHLAGVLPQLQTVKVGGDRKRSVLIVSLTALGGLHTLTMLDLEWCNVNISPLSSLPQLTQLVLSECTVRGAYSSLQHMRHLDLTGSLESPCQQLCTLIGLTYLAVEVNDIFNLNRLIALEHLAFTTFGPQVEAMVLDLVSLSNLTRLTHLEICCGGRDLLEAFALAALPQLQRLVLDVPISSLPLSALLQLVRLELGEVYDADLQALAMLSQLTHLVSFIWVVTSFQAMSSLQQLRFLKLRDVLWDARAVSSLAHISVLTALQELYLEEFLNVVDLSDISALRQLRCPELANCYSVKDFSSISSLHQLTRLHLRGVGITDAHPIGFLTQLQSLYLFGQYLQDVGSLTSLQCLTGLTMLEHMLHAPAVQLPAQLQRRSPGE